MSYPNIAVFRVTTHTTGQTLTLKCIAKGEVSYPNIAVFRVTTHTTGQTLTLNNKSVNQNVLEFSQNLFRVHGIPHIVNLVH